MRQDLDRIKSDLETMEKALGGHTSISRDWLLWMKRDRWIGLWWCLPGVILIATALVPHDRTQRYLGLMTDQWMGLLVCAVLLGLAHFLTRKVTADDGRPPALIRETKLLNGFSVQGFWFMVALLLELAVYFLWGKQYGIPAKAFWAGLFIFMGSSCLVGAVSAKAWPLLGWAIPFLAYALCLPLAERSPRLSGVLFGLMFIAVALSFSLIAVLQIRMVERQSETY
jgi:hypothetical protein